MAKNLSQTLFVCCGVAMMPCSVAAHPHEFIDAAVTFHIDDGGMLGSVSMTWVFDDFTTLMILEDNGLDSDNDGVLRADETEVLREIFGNWPEDFDGDLSLTYRGEAVALSGPVGLTADVKDDRIVIDFARSLVAPVRLSGDPLTMQAYDPSYYAFYDLAGVPAIDGGGDCRVSVEHPDTRRAEQLYQQALEALTEEDVMDGKYPEVGGAFADIVRVTCAD